MVHGLLEIEIKLIKCSPKIVSQSVIFGHTR